MHKYRYETGRGSAVSHGAFSKMRVTDITHLMLHAVTVLQTKIIKMEQKSFHFA